MHWVKASFSDRNTLDSSTGPLNVRPSGSVPTALIGIVTLGVLLGVRRVPEPLVILAAGLVGVMWR